MKEYAVAILGATGAVGREMMKVLEERNLPIHTLRLLASARSAGKKLTFRGQEITIEEATDEAFTGMDFVFGAVSNAMAKRFTPAIQAAGAVFIDNSSAYRMDPEVPLVIPEINPDDALQHHGIIANPNCSTIITLMAVAGIRQITPIESIVACTYQAVSGAGQEGIHELQMQEKAAQEDGEFIHNMFPCRIFENAIPQIGSELENGYTTEEMKMQNEGRKILHLPDLKVCCTCVRVPVMRSHSISVQMRTRDEITVDAAKAAIAAMPGCVLTQDIDGRNYPTPMDTTDQDLVFVGRVRRDLLNESHGLALWCCGDQIRKGAATNAVQIAQLLMAR